MHALQVALLLVVRPAQSGHRDVVGFGHVLLGDQGVEQRLFGLLGDAEAGEDPRQPLIHLGVEHGDHIANPFDLGMAPGKGIRQGRQLGFIEREFFQQPLQEGVEGSRLHGALQFGAGTVAQLAEGGFQSGELGLLLDARGLQLAERLRFQRRRGQALLGFEIRDAKSFLEIVDLS
ncbi:MAG: hypothetical protein DME25_22265, partial [Verrucomicrobia bacterium]